jgi:hypothetical protein
MNRWLRVSCLAPIVIFSGRSAFPQTPPAGRVEVSVGIVRFGSASFGSRDAQESTGTTGGTFRLFSSSSELTGTSGAAARIGMTILRRRLDAELSGSYTRPQLRTQILTDVEASNAPAVLSVAVQQFTVGGAALWYLPAPWLAARTTVFLRGGIDLERHLEDSGTRVVDGRSFEAGGGAKYLLLSRSPGRLKGIGARVDALALVRANAVTLDRRTHLSPAIGASIYLRF